MRAQYSPGHNIPGHLESTPKGHGTVMTSKWLHTLTWRIVCVPKEVAERVYCSYRPFAFSHSLQVFPSERIAILSE